MTVQEIEEALEQAWTLVLSMEEKLDHLETHVKLNQEVEDMYKYV